jgi:hypothetical protein
MKVWVLGGVLVVASGVTAHAQEPCAPGKSRPLVQSLTPVTGQSPMWVTTGAGPIAWKGPNDPVTLLWIRDVSVAGSALLNGQRRGSAPVKVRFSAPGSTLGVREERYKLDQIGFKPGKVTPEDLQKYSFHRTNVWFSEPGCYELTARVGRQQSVIVLKVDGPAGK